MDGVRNQPRYFQTENFPTIILYSKKNPHAPLYYQGEAKSKSIKDFIISKKDV
jgi:hypothetical protein